MKDGDLLIIPCRLPAFLNFINPLEVAEKRFFAPEFVFIFGI